MLINLRNALMAGKRLPYDAEVEYLESSGTQYINTGIKPGPNTRVEIVFAMTTFTANCGLFGARGQTITNNLSYNLFIVNYAGQNQVRWDWSGNGVYKTSQTETSTVATYNLGVAGSTITRDGVFLLDVSAGKTAIDYPIYIFNFNNVGTPFSTGANARFWSVKIYDGQTIVFDAIPVRKGTVGYLYDRVSGRLFGNAGTGDFVLGPDVVPVEYIESHGTEWIDTGVVGYKTTKIESSCALKNATTAYPAMWGARTNSYINDFQVYYQATSIGGIPTSIILRTGNSQKEISMSDIGASTLIGTRLNVIVADGTIYVNDRAFTTPAFSNFTTPHSILAFCQYSSRPANQGAFVYWGLKMWQGESLIRSFCPVRVGTDATSWEGAMMDVLTRRIYRNAGTGAFTYGNDLKYPIPAS